MLKSDRRSSFDSVGLWGEACGGTLFSAAGLRAAGGFGPRGPKAAKRVREALMPLLNKMTATFYGSADALAKRNKGLSR